MRDNFYGEDPKEELEDAIIKEGEEEGPEGGKKVMNFSDKMKSKIKKAKNKMVLNDLEDICLSNLEKELSEPWVLKRDDAAFVTYDFSG